MNKNQLINRYNNYIIQRNDFVQDCNSEKIKEINFKITELKEIYFLFYGEDLVI